MSALSFVEQGYDQDAAEQPAHDAESERARSRLGARPAEQRLRVQVRVPLLRVRGRAGRAELLPGFEAALEADRLAEMSRAIDAVVDIAADRAAKLGVEDAQGGHGMIELGRNRYGKAAIHVVRVARDEGGHRGA